MRHNKNEFNNEEHEAKVTASWARLIEQRRNYALFDKFVDLALDGVITMPEAIEGYQEEAGIKKAAPNRAA